MNSQISMFQLLDEYETPGIPLEEQKAGVKGWIIDISCICLRKNFCKEEFTGVETCPIIFNRDTRKDKDGYWTQDAECTKGPYSGWVCHPKRVFRRRPTWNDCLKYGREKAREKGYPENIRYYSRDGAWNEINSYEDGY